MSKYFLNSWNFFSPLKKNPQQTHPVLQSQSILLKIYLQTSPKSCWKQTILVLGKETNSLPASPPPPTPSLSRASLSWALLHAEPEDPSRATQASVPLRAGADAAWFIGEPGDPFPRRITAIKPQPAPVCHLLVCLISGEKQLAL